MKRYDKWKCQSDHNLQNILGRIFQNKWKIEFVQSLLKNQPDLNELKKKDMR